MTVYETFLRLVKAYKEQHNCSLKTAVMEINKITVRDSEGHLIGFVCEECFQAWADSIT